MDVWTSRGVGSNATPQHGAQHALQPQHSAYLQPSAAQHNASLPLKKQMSQPVAAAHSHQLPSLPSQRRQPIVRQSTHDRIEQLLHAARNTGSTVADEGALLAAGGGGGGGAGGAGGAGVGAGGTEGGAAGGGAGEGAGGAVVGPVWHSVHVCVCEHPYTRAPVLVVTQHDVTRQMDARTQLTMLLEREQKILESIFPRHVIEYLTLQQPAEQSTRGGRRGGGAAAGGGAGLLALQRSSAAQLASVATAHPNVTIMFADIVGFTNMCKQVSPLEVMTFLNQLYSRFDALLDIYKVYKVETIGDCFMVAGGLVAQDEDGWRTTITHDRLHAVRVLAFAKAMLREARKVNLPTGGPVMMRVGMHSGPVMSGVVGSRMPRFCLFGDTVNTASRMESTSQPGRIHVSGDTQALLPSERWDATGGVQVKGKGCMPTYLWANDASEEKGEQLQRVLGIYL